MKWAKQSEFYARADKRDDGSHYSLFKLQQGRCYFAVWRWPTERRFKTDGRVHEMDHIYEGPDAAEAVRLCKQHWKRRNEGNEA